MTTEGDSLIDFGPTGDFYGFDPGRNNWTSYATGGRITQTAEISNNLYPTGIPIKGVNLGRLKQISDRLNTKPGFYNFAVRSCSSVAARSLTVSGVPVIGLHPYLLQAQVYLWNSGIRPWTISYYNQ